MKKFISISEFPGKTGTFYYNESFKILGVNASYTAVKANYTNFENILTNALNEGVSGISISMPFKKSVISYLTNMDELVKKYELCNTILCSDRVMNGFNCDYFGLKKVTSNIPKNYSIKILGNGCIGSMTYKFLSEHYKVKIYSRSLMNWDQRYEPSDVVINCTSLGTIPGIPIEELEGVQLVLDYCINSKELPVLCKKNNIEYLGGIEFYKYQFLNQFLIYTDIDLNPSFFDDLNRIIYDF